MKNKVKKIIQIAFRENINLKGFHWRIQEQVVDLFFSQKKTKTYILLLPTNCTIDVANKMIRLKLEFSSKMKKETNTLHNKHISTCT